MKMRRMVQCEIGFRTKSRSRRMEKGIAIVLVLYILGLSLESVCSEVREDDDTIVINAADVGDEESLNSLSSRRLKRQFLFESPAVLPAQIGVKLEGSLCDSLENKRGNCTTIPDCYPLLYASEGEENREPGLVEFFKASSGVCEEMPFAVPAFRHFPIFLQAPPPKELICCTSGQEGAKPIMSSSSDHTKPEKFVVGGRLVNNISKYPWLVSLHIRGRHSCGGSLISPSTVLTAAHCLMGLRGTDVASMKVYFGHHDISQKWGGMLHSRTVAQAKYHRGFSMRRLNDDIGLIILNAPIPQNNPKIKPVTLGALTGADKKVTVAGWGQTSWTSGTSSRLLEATMDSWTHSRCQTKYTGFQVPVRIAADKQVCAGSPGKDSCRGDSGSALHVTRNGKSEQVGIVSFGGKCGDYPGVYTRVAAYKAWIQKNWKA